MKNPGQYEIVIGKFSGKRLEQIEFAKLEAYIKTLRTKVAEQRGRCSTALRFLFVAFERYRIYLNGGNPHAEDEVTRGRSQRVDFYRRSLTGSNRSGNLTQGMVRDSPIRDGHRLFHYRCEKCSAEISAWTHRVVIPISAFRCIETDDCIGVMVQAPPHKFSPEPEWEVVRESDFSNPGLRKIR